MAKKPALTFNLEQDDSGPVMDAPSAPPAQAITKPKTGRALKQIGARLPEQLYRQLKAHAALTGEQVQNVLEAAIAEYLQRRAGS